MRRVARGGYRPQHQALFHADGVAVGDGGAGEGHVGRGRHQVGGAGETGQLQTAGDVVVVQVGLGHVADAHPAPRRGGDHLVDVARRVDDDRATGAADQIAAIAQALGLQSVDEEHCCGSFTRNDVPRGVSVLTLTGVPRGVFLGNVHAGADDDGIALDDRVVDPVDPVSPARGNVLCPQRPCAADPCGD